MSDELRFPTPERLKSIKEIADTRCVVDASDVYDLLAALETMKVMAGIYFDIALTGLSLEEVRREREERINSFVAHQTRPPNEW